MEIVIRAAIMFLLLWVITRAAGRSTLGELSSFELILFIVMGDLVQEGIIMGDTSLTGSLLAVGTMVVLTVAFAYINMRWPKVGKVIQGRPIILIRDGEVDRRALHNERIGLDELSMMARLSNIESYEQVRLAILEANGQISFFTQESESTDK